MSSGVVDVIERFDVEEIAERDVRKSESVVLLNRHITVRAREDDITVRNGLVSPNAADVLRRILETPVAPR